MPDSCAVFNCANTRANSEESFHRFPRDKNVRQNWVSCCKRADKFNPSKSLICSNHFQAEDFELDFRNVLLGSKPKKQLKPGVVPHVNLPRSVLAFGSSNKTECCMKRDLRMKERESKKARLQLVEDAFREEYARSVGDKMERSGFSPIEGSTRSMEESINFPATDNVDLPAANDIDLPAAENIDSSMVEDIDLPAAANTRVTAKEKENTAIDYQALYKQVAAKNAELQRVNMELQQVIARNAEETNELRRSMKIKLEKLFKMRGCTKFKQSKMTSQLWK